MRDQRVLQMQWQGDRACGSGLRAAPPEGRRAPRDDLETSRAAQSEKAQCFFCSPQTRSHELGVELQEDHAVSPVHSVKDRLCAYNDPGVRIDRTRRVCCPC